MVSLSALGGSRDQPPTLVGRAHEQTLLSQRLADALGGRGGLVLIGGEAGIGKTALAEATCREAADHGALTLIGRSFDLADTPPYGPWLDLFGDVPLAQDVQPFAARIQHGAASRDTLFTELRDFLVSLAARGPLVLLLEDLHWADPASLELLRFLARDLAALPVLCLLAYRTDELGRQHPLYGLLPLIAREARAVRLDLPPLDESAVRSLVAARYRMVENDERRLVTHLQERAEGNPFFLGELLRTLEEEHLLRPSGHGWDLGALERARVPSFLRQVIDGRLARLGPRAHRLLTVAAVIGQEAPLTLWAKVGDVEDEELLALLERATEMHLLVAATEGTSVRFVHALIREALYEGLLAPRRRLLHRSVGEALLATSATDPDLVAYHLRRAGDARAGAWLVRAGERAQRAYAWLTAAERYETALALLEEQGGDARDRGWLLYRLASLRRYADPRSAVAALDRAVQLATTAGDQGLTAYATFNRGHLRCYVEDIRGGLADMEAGVAALDSLPLPAREDLVRLQDTIGISPSENCAGTLAAWLALTGRFDEARTLGERATAFAPAGRTHGGWDGYYAADAHFGLALTHAAMGRPDEARQAFARAREGYRAIDHHFLVGAMSLYELCWVVLPFRADDPMERERLAFEAERALALAGGVLGEQAPGLARVPILQLAGSWDEARRLVLGERSTPGAGAWWRGVFTSILAPLAREQGDADLAWTLVREALPAGAATLPGDAIFAPTLILQRTAAMLAIDAGDLATARAWLAAHDRWLAWSGAVLGRAEGQLVWAACHRAAGNSALARRCADRALEHAATPRQPLALIAAHRLLGELDTLARRHADAAAHLETALDLAQNSAATYERALTVLAMVELRRATGKRSDARALLREARAIFAGLGARPALARADAVAKTLEPGASPRSGYPDGLTAREVEVLRLVAVGLTDAEVAARLFLSPHTVHVHLRSIYGKLGVPSRSAATRYAVEHHIA